MAAKGNYERVETTFSKSDELDIELYRYLDEKAKVMGKGTYLKQLLYEDMLKNKESK